MKRGHVLLVDDDPDTQLLVEKTLRPLGYFVESAPDGRKALSATLGKREPPHLILLGYKIPGKDGLSVLKELRSYSELDKTRIIMITAAVQPEIVKQAIQSGVNDFLIKPLDQINLVERVRKWCPLEEKP